MCRAAVAGGPWPSAWLTRKLRDGLLCVKGKGVRPSGCPRRRNHGLQALGRAYVSRMDALNASRESPWPAASSRTLKWKRRPRERELDPLAGVAGGMRFEVAPRLRRVTFAFEMEVVAAVPLGDPERGHNARESRVTAAKRTYRAMLERPIASTRCRAPRCVWMGGQADGSPDTNRV